MKKINSLSKTLVLQKDNTDCGVCCLLSIIRYYDGDSNLESLRRLSGTSKNGTTLLGLQQASTMLGFNSEGCEATIPSLIEHGKALILHVEVEKGVNHYVVCYSAKNNEFIIGDPAKGVSKYSQIELNKIWKSKFCLTLEPNEKFVKNSSKIKTKRKWFLEQIKDDVGLHQY